MKGIDIFKRDTATFGPYAKMLLMLVTTLGETVTYAKLEEAEALGKKLAIDEEAVAVSSDLDDDITADSIIFV